MAKKKYAKLHVHINVQSEQPAMVKTVEEDGCETLVVPETSQSVSKLSERRIHLQTLFVS